MIDVLKGRSQQDLQAIGDAVHEAMTEHLGVPQRDRFQIVTQHEPRQFQFDRGYLDIEIFSTPEAFWGLPVEEAAARAAAAGRSLIAQS